MRSTAGERYLTQTLPSLGELVVQYYGTGHSSLDNYITMTSGQGPNSSTQGDCDDKSVLGGSDTSPKGHFEADGQYVDDSDQSPANPGCDEPVQPLLLPAQHGRSVRVVAPRLRRAEVLATFQSAGDFGAASAG